MNSPRHIGYVSPPLRLAYIQPRAQWVHNPEDPTEEVQMQIPEIWMVAQDRDHIRKNVRRINMQADFMETYSEILHSGDSTLREFIRENPGRFNIKPRVESQFDCHYIMIDDISRTDRSPDGRFFRLYIQKERSNQIALEDGTLVPELVQGELNRIYSYVDYIEYDTELSIISVHIITEHYELRNSDGLPTEGYWQNEPNVPNPYGDNVYAKSHKRFTSNKLRQRLWDNMADRRKVRGNLVLAANPQETKALETLRDMISESAFRKYLKYGFLSVTCPDGKTYQLFRDRWHTKVWKSGQLVEEICVRLQRDVPPTDSVIAFKTMLEADIEEFRSIGNVYKMKRVA